MPINPTIRLVALLAAAALTFVACGGDETSFDSLDPSTQNLVLFESGWQCEVSRFAVDDPAELDRLRADRADAHDITDGAYQAFLDRLATDDDLARIVSDVTSDCLDSGEPIQL
ncbi:MAG: hypothetical protein AAF480_15930 [Actinomycetota bacterium]